MCVCVCELVDFREESKERFLNKNKTIWHACDFLSGRSLGSQFPQVVFDQFSQRVVVCMFIVFSVVARMTVNKQKVSSQEFVGVLACVLFHHFLD